MASHTRRLTAAALAGATVLVAATAAYLPPPRALLRAPATPLDRSLARHFAPAFALITEARRVVPPAACMTVTTEPPSLDNMTERLGVALLPGRSMCAASLSEKAAPDIVSRAEYVVVVGGAPAAPPGDLLFARPEGTVWRKRAQ